MKHRVIVLFGGRSDERHVSVASGQNIVRTLGVESGWFWAPDGSVIEVTADELLAHQRPFEVDFAPKTTAQWPSLEAAVYALADRNCVFYLGLHGGEGEDGTVQKLLEQSGMPFTGSGSEASAAAFDKAIAKKAAAEHVLIAESRNASTVDEVRQATIDLLTRHERVVLKPLAAGSSRGLFFVGRNDELDPILAKIAELRIPYLIEQYVAGRELTVGVADLGDGPVPLPVIEIEVDPGFSFDYEGKYLGKGTREICPAQIPEAMRRSAQATALAAHTSLACEGYSRTDLMATDDGGMYFLEVNTLPGLTTSSLVPQELAEAGIAFREFLEKQLELAIERAERASTVRR